MLTALLQTLPAEPSDDSVRPEFLVLGGLGVLLLVVIVIALYRSSAFLPHDPDAPDREWPD
ncbi:hypothetical protein [Actinocorallia aurea]